MSPDSMEKWPQSQPPPQPPQQPPYLTPRSPGSDTADDDEFRVSEILAIVASALNLLVATAL